MGLVRLSPTVQKCGTCERWTGLRQGCSDGLQVEFDVDQTEGVCLGGPWDGNVRDPLSRCGRWIVWLTRN